jgi:2'-deoxynucleoside 5'-phosphate N-hydrolase
MNKVYISGALTGIKEPLKIKSFYESIGSVCSELGLYPYVPHLKTDPIKNPDISPSLVFETDKHEVSQSDLVIAYIGFPSLGVGMELAYAEMHKIPVILLYEVNSHISRFPRGIPTIISEIQFRSYEDALNLLRESLESWTGKLPVGLGIRRILNDSSPTSPTLSVY